MLLSGFKNTLKKNSTRCHCSSIPSYKFDLNPTSLITNPVKLIDQKNWIYRKSSLIKNIGCLCYILLKMLAGCLHVEICTMYRISFNVYLQHGVCSWNWSIWLLWWCYSCENKATELYQILEESKDYSQYRYIIMWKCPQVNISFEVHGDWPSRYAEQRSQCKGNRP